AATELAWAVRRGDVDGALRAAASAEALLDAPDGPDDPEPPDGADPPHLRPPASLRALVAVGKGTALLRAGRLGAAAAALGRALGVRGRAGAVGSGAGAGADLGNAVCPPPPWLRQLLATAANGLRTAGNGTPPAPAPAPQSAIVRAAALLAGGDTAAAAG